VLDEKGNAPLTVLEVGKHRAGQKLLPHRLPETLDLSAGLRVMRPALHVPDAVAPQLFLEIRRAAPGRVLPPLIRQDLARRAVVSNASGQGLHHQRALLVMRHRQAHQVARVIVQEGRHIHPLVLAQQKSKKVRLPELIGLGTLKTHRLGLRLGLGWLPLLGDALSLQHPAHRRLRRANPEETLHHVPDPPATSLRLLPLHRHDRLAPRIPLALRPRLRLQPLHTASPIPTHPLAQRRVRHRKPARRLIPARLPLHHRPRYRQPDIQRPALAHLPGPSTCLVSRLHLSTSFIASRQAIQGTSAR
jgi:hypothetical protein